ncbi:DNA polymerase III subunit delta' [Pediococcus pentosaceus]|uniref:DNA polymerase III subunit delta' n=1 Tax=Pediococcus pentosaceus TaxID=1255 RepID=UPI003D803DBD
MEDLKNLTNQAVEKQPEIVKRFNEMIDSQHLSHAYLLTGADGIGKKDVAQWVAMRLFCIDLQGSMPCGECEECTRIISGQHPDVVEIAPDGQSIKVEQVRFLKAEFSKSGVEGARKVFIIEQANKMTTSAANSLLKFIEEPSGEVTAFLLAENRSLMLPTIVSRTEIIELKPLPKDRLIKELTEQNIAETDARILTRLTNDTSEIQTLVDNNWILDAHKALEKWFITATTGDITAFVDVQTRVMALAKDRFYQEKILDLMMLYAMDLLELKFDQETITYEANRRQLQELADQTNVRQLLAVADVLLPLKHQLSQNLNFQSVVEKATIKICNIFKMRGR